MLCVEEIEDLKEKLRRRLAEIIMNAHATLDAEYIRLTAKIDRFREAHGINSQVPDLSTIRKTITIKIDLNAVEILSALRCLKENRYGKWNFCPRCHDVREVLIRN